MPCKMVHPVDYFNEIESALGNLAWVLTSFSWHDISLGGGGNDVANIMTSLVDEFSVDKTGTLKKALEALKNNGVNERARSFWSNHTVN